MSKSVDQMDQQFKNWLMSKTIWGILIALAPIISGFFGFDVSTELGESYEELVQIAGASLALYGRWKANGKIVAGKVKNIKKKD